MDIVTYVMAKKYADKVSAETLIKSHTYSTSEQVVGTWIDGKPIYQKTVYIDNITSGSGSGAKTTDYLHGIENLKEVINYYAVLSPAEITDTIDGGDAASIPKPPQVGGTGYNFGISIYKTFIRTKNNFDMTGKHAYVTILYTKTTDYPQTP